MHQLKTSQRTAVQSSINHWDYTSVHQVPRGLIAHVTHLSGRYSPAAVHSHTDASSQFLLPKPSSTAESSSETLKVRQRVTQVESVSTDCTCASSVCSLLLGWKANRLSRPCAAITLFRRSIWLVGINKFKVYYHLGFAPKGIIRVLWWLGRGRRRGKGRERGRKEEGREQWKSDNIQAFWGVWRQRLDASLSFFSNSVMRLSFLSSSSFSDVMSRSIDWKKEIDGHQTSIKHPAFPCVCNKSWRPCVHLHLLWNGPILQTEYY